MKAEVESDDDWVEKQIHKWKEDVLRTGYLNFTRKGFSQLQVESLLRPLIYNDVNIVKQCKLLSLNYNQLLSIPRGVFNLSHLTQLGLCHNKLRSLPHLVGKSFPVLKFLDISGNEIVRLPTSLTKLTSLNNLVWSGNEELELGTGNAQEKLLLIAKHFAPSEERYQSCLRSATIFLGLKRWKKCNWMKPLDRAVILIVARMMKEAADLEWEV